MRISTSQIYQQGLNAMLDQQTGLLKTQLQLSSGKRILTPADDPAGSAQALELNQTLDITNQYNTNANAATSRLNLEDSTLSSFTDTLQRVRELAVQANSSTLSSSDRASIATEVKQRLSQLLALANTKNANGEYLFAGSKGQTQPFAQTGSGFSYSGDQGSRYLQVGPSTQVAVGDSGSDAFMVIRNGNGTFTTLNNPANTGSGVIDPGTVSNSSVYVPGTYSLIMAQKTNVTGGALSFTDTGTVDTLGYQLSINGTLVYTGANPSTQTQAQIAASIAAQSATTGVTAYVNNGVLYLANTTPSTQPISVTETLTGASDATDTVTGYFGSALTGAAPSNTLTVSTVPADSYVAVDSTNAVVAGGAYQSGGSISFNGIQTSVTGTPNNGDRFTISPSANQDIFSTVQNLINTMDSPMITPAQQASAGNAYNRGLANIDQALNNLDGMRARVGARLNTIDSQQTANNAYVLQTQQNLSNVQDLDYAKAASQLTLQQTILQAAQQAFVKVQSLSLFNFIR